MREGDGMSIFIVQADNGSGIMDDFSLELVKACQYQNWYDKSLNHTVYLEANGAVQVIGDVIKQTLTELKRNKTGVIPIGSLEYVQDHMGGKKVKPINVPLELCDWYFTKREVYRLESLSDLNISSVGKQARLFIKSDTRCKTNITGEYSLEEIDKLRDSGVELFNERLFASSVVDIQAEWRAFVFNGKIIDVRQYTGDWQEQYKAQFILDAVRAYKDCPPAYTLDVGILKDGRMVIIEAHNFIACGLYGFNDARILPQMFASAYNHEIKR